MGAPGLAPGLIAGGMAAGGIMSAIGQKQSATAQSNYYNYLSATSTMNAGLATAAGVANTQAVGVEAANEMRQSVNRKYQTIGAQKVAMVGGVGGSSRSAQQIIGNTANLANQDEEAINLNAEMKAKAIFAGSQTAAFNATSQAGGDILAGSNIRAALPFQMGSSLLGGATQSASQYAMMSMYMGGNNITSPNYSTPWPSNMGSSFTP